MSNETLALVLTFASAQLAQLYALVRLYIQLKEKIVSNGFKVEAHGQEIQQAVTALSKKVENGYGSQPAVVTPTMPEHLK